MLDLPTPSGLPSPTARLHDLELLHSAGPIAPDLGVAGPLVLPRLVQQTLHGGLDRVRLLPERRLALSLPLPQEGLGNYDTPATVYRTQLRV